MADVPEAWVEPRTGLRGVPRRVCSRVRKRARVLAALFEAQLAAELLDLVQQGKVRPDEIEAWLPPGRRDSWPQRLQPQLSTMVDNCTDKP